MKSRVRRRLAGVVAMLAALAFAGGAYTAGNDPSAGTPAFMRVVAKRMDLTPSQLRNTVEQPPPLSRHDVRSEISRWHHG